MGGEKNLVATWISLFRYFRFINACSYITLLYSKNTFWVFRSNTIRIAFNISRSSAKTYSNLHIFNLLFDCWQTKMAYGLGELPSCSASKFTLYCNAESEALMFGGKKPAHHIVLCYNCKISLARHVAPQHWMTVANFSFAHWLCVEDSHKK